MYDDVVEKLIIRTKHKHISWRICTFADGASWPPYNEKITIDAIYQANYNDGFFYFASFNRESYFGLNAQAYLHGQYLSVCEDKQNLLKRLHEVIKHQISTEQNKASEFLLDFLKRG